MQPVSQPRNPVSGRSDASSSGEPVAENTPLLHNGRPAGHGSIKAAKYSLSNRNDAIIDVGKPSTYHFPYRQILLLCYARMMEPIAFFSIFPFVAQMVQRNAQLPESDVGFYSGLIESLFSVMQTVVMLFWGKLADKVGRKPALVFSLVGTSVAAGAFGMASTLWQMILFRCLAGVFSGSNLIIRTMISDHCTPETQALAYSWFAFAGNVGIFLGPLIGGALADPVNQFPNVFGNSSILEDNPYMLSGLAIGLFCATGAFATLIGLEETLKNVKASSAVRSSESLSISQISKARGVAIVLWVYSHFLLIAFAFTAVIPVYLYTAVRLGGLGLSPVGISIYTASQGIFQAIWQLLGFPFLHRRLGTKKILIACANFYPIFFVGHIVLSVLLRISGDHAIAWFWTLGGFIIFAGPGITMSSTATQLALNDVSPNPMVLGILNALALMASSAIRSVMPAVMTAVFAVGVRNQYIWGYLAWVILILLAVALRATMIWVPNDREERKDEDEEARS